MMIYTNSRKLIKLAKGLLSSHRVNETQGYKGYKEYY